MVLKKSWRPHEINEAVISLSIRAKVPLLVWGPPGAGKTAVIEWIGRELGDRVVVVIAALHDPTDFSGLPVLKVDRMVFMPPDWAVELGELEGYNGGLLFLDEVSTAPYSVQAALLRVVHERVVGRWRLPSNVSIIAAANPPELAAGGMNITPPLANRFCHYEWQLDPQAIAEGFIFGWPKPVVPILPPGWENLVQQHRAVVGAFLKARPDLVSQPPRAGNDAVLAWPSSRTWDMWATLLTASRVAGVGPDVEAALCAGCVGPGAAQEFLAWEQKMDLPDPEDLLQNPAAFTLPNRGDRAYAVLGGVIAAATSRMTPERWLAAWQILARAADQGGVDIAAAAARALAQARQPGLPLPVDLLAKFQPILRAAGMI